MLGVSLCPELRPTIVAPSLLVIWGYSYWSLYTVSTVTTCREAEDMCIDPASATPVTRVLTYSANASDCTFT